MIHVHRHVLMQVLSVCFLIKKLNYYIQILFSVSVNTGIFRFEGIIGVLHYILIHNFQKAEFIEFCWTICAFICVHIYLGIYDLEIFFKVHVAVIFCMTSQENWAEYISMHVLKHIKINAYFPVNFFFSGSWIQCAGLYMCKWPICDGCLGKRIQYTG